MLQVHRDALRQHRVALVQDMDLAFVFDGLVQRNIFDPADYEDFEVGINQETHLLQAVDTIDIFFKKKITDQNLTPNRDDSKFIVRLISQLTLTFPNPPYVFV